jgi:DNA-binding IclR family transcriptional regulator
MDLKSELRVLGLFELFAAAGQPMQVSELAERLGAPLSSCFKLVRAIEERGYLYAPGARGALYPTRRLHDLGRTLLEHDPVSATIRVQLAALRDTVGETVCLGVRRGRDVVFLEVVESPHAIRFTLAAGDTRSLHANATGKAILSTLPPAALRRALQELSYERHSASTLTDAEALAADIERSRGEAVADALAIAVPVRIGGDGYGLGIVGPTYRMEPLLDGHLRALRAAADAIALDRR